MTEHTESSFDALQTYRIGAVARLTGISVDRLRAWERRYGVVDTRRTASLGRVYTRDDVDRLLIIKQLLDFGNPISSVATLSTDQLCERLKRDHGCQQAVATHASAPARAVVYGPMLTSQLETAPNAPAGLQIIGAYRNFSDFERAAPTLAPDVLVLEYPGVYPETIDEVHALLQRSATKRAVVVYGFGRQDVLDRMGNLGARVVRAPVSLDELALACCAPLPSDEPTRPDATVTPEPGDAIPPRRFTEDTLARLASASRSLPCECPEHLVSLITSLSAFEAYSAQCRHRHADDAALHAYLHRITAQTRDLIEEALEYLADAEQLPR